MKKYSLFFFLTFLGMKSYAQELNCNVQIIAPQISDVDKRIFETLQKSIFEFLNNTKWTNDVYQTDERIECSMLITVNEKKSSDEYQATIQVQARRPIYKTSYKAPLLNINDNDFTFRYVEYQALEFNENTFSNNLTAVLAFYAYVIIGLDYDSFSLEGGTPFFQKAQTIVNNAQNAPDKGWRAFEDNKNRYWLIENLLNSNFKPLRATLYKYHRLGLDNMTTDMESSRATILGSIESLKTVFDASPGSYLMQVFFIAKADEIVNIFSQAYPDVKAKIVPLLTQIDPGNSSKYQTIQGGN